VPLEESRDILALQSGEKFVVPFDTLVIFSTNFHPNEIFDGAALRRIFFKIKIDGPDQENFLKIFAMVAQEEGDAAGRGGADPSAQGEVSDHRQQLCQLSAGLPDRPDDLGLRVRRHPLPDDARLIDRAWANMFVKKPNVSKEELLKYYREMLLIRRFEEKAGQLYGMGLIGGFCHLYIGQEAVVVGLEAASKEGDKRVTSYRDHGHMLACGMDAKGVMAELTGRIGGYSKGKGGSMHMFSKEKHFYGGHGIVGAQVPLGAGWPLPTSIWAMTT
jgi:hypothetical protein